MFDSMLFFFLPPPFHSWWFVLFFCLSFIRHVHIECSTHFKLYVVERIARLNPITSCVHCVWFYCVCICAARERSWIYCVITFISIFSQFQPKICSLILLFGHSMCIFFFLFWLFWNIFDTHNNLIHCFGLKSFVLLLLLLSLNFANAQYFPCSLTVLFRDNQ